MLRPWSPCLEAAQGLCLSRYDDVVAINGSTHPPTEKGFIPCKTRKWTPLDGSTKDSASPTAVDDWQQPLAHSHVSALTCWSWSWSPKARQVSELRI